MYQSAPVVGGTAVLGVTLVPDSPLASSPIGRGALAVTGISVAMYVAVALVLLLVGFALRVYARVAAER